MSLCPSSKRSIGVGIKFSLDRKISDCLADSSLLGYMTLRGETGKIFRISTAPGQFVKSTEFSKIFYYFFY